MGHYRLGFAIALAGCGRVWFDPRIDGSIVGDEIGADTSVLCRWSPPTFGPVVFRSELSSGTLEEDPFVVPGDPLTVYLGSNRANGLTDIFEAHRATIDSPFDPPIALASLNTPGDFESALVVDRGAIHGYFTAGPVTVLIYEVARVSTADPWVIVRSLDEVNTQPLQFDPWPSPDELTLHFTAGPDTSTLTIYEATRASTALPWSNVVPLPINMPGAKNSGATLTADQRVIVWSAPGTANEDLFYAVRSDASQPFGAPQRLPLSTADRDLEPNLREDGCELFFVTGTGASTTWDIYSVSLQP